jgi:hypothetical protein
MRSDSITVFKRCLNRKSASVKRKRRVRNSRDSKRRYTLELWTTDNLLDCFVSIQVNGRRSLVENEDLRLYTTLFINKQ